MWFTCWDVPLCSIEAKVVLSCSLVAWPITCTKWSSGVWVGHVIVIRARGWLSVFKLDYNQQVITTITPQFQHKIFASSLLPSDWLTPIMKIKLVNSIVIWTNSLHEFTQIKMVEITKCLSWWSGIVYGTYDWNRTKFLIMNCTPRCHISYKYCNRRDADITNFTAGHKHFIFQSLHCSWKVVARNT